MTAKEAQSWRCFFKVFGPVGHERFDLNAATIAKAVVDGYADHEKYTPSLEDFVPKFKFTRPLDEDEFQDELKTNALRDFEYLQRRFRGVNSG
ncbi:MAG: hypothetical protein LBC20_18150 [Planctomycetaceae bacterium]|jgi:hypothetical protein|nr:hypothetical protein [Planctomycetaceae bacterium]